MKLLFAALAISLSAVAQSTGQPSLSEILARMTTMNDARAAALRQYTSNRAYEVSYQGFPKSASAKAMVRLQFTAPDKKEFTIIRQEGAKFMVNRVIRKALESEQEAGKPEFRNRSALNGSNYDFKFAGTDREDGRLCYLLDVKPKREDKYLYNGQICVDAADYAVARIQAKPAKNPSFWISKATIDHHNKKIGDFWFPATNRSTSHVRLGGDAELRIDYTDYLITNATKPATP